ncbi:metallophosphoesterase [Buchananella hordeovulneris]|uniref:metallophosphoesterase n=1 Tax=Buchananella hordeovulneris TaxID=52770 RepID=UPI000F5DB564|nr:metallophosphoesterase [Buchananella hordeovulneris]RRD42179.1 metallophosphoesterase [Buchananella hordeovulneris]
MWRLVGRSLGWAALAGAATLGWALAEAEAYRDRHVVVPLGARRGGVDRHPAAGLRILQVADPHLAVGDRRRAAYLARLAELEPDLVIATGDNLGGVDALPELLTALSPLLRLPGAFVLGSNDYWAPKLKSPTRYLRRDPRQADDPAEERVALPTAELVAAFTDAGWLDATNTRGRVRAGRWSVEITGVDDPHLDADRFPVDGVDEGAEGRQAAGGTEGGAAGAPDLRLGLAHAPYRRVLNQFAAAGADLVLAGHTHGGQLRVPGWGALVTNCDLPTRHAAGLFPWPETASPTWVHVDAGIGTSPMAPVRLACRPGATLLTIL